MKLQDVLIKLLIEQPFYGTIASLITPIESNRVKTVQMTIIPTMKLVYNAQWFDNLPTHQQKGIVIHELLHVLFMHPFRRENREEAIWAIACDMAVNEYIESFMLWSDAITVDKIVNVIKTSLPKKQTAEVYYHYLLDHDEQIAFIGREDDVLIMVDGQQHLKANKISDEKATEVQKNALKNQLANRMEESKLEGQLPDDISPILDEVYEELKLNWRNVLKRFLTGRGKIVIRKSYKRQSRRYDHLPGTKRSVGVRALVAIDESGSISDGYISKFYNELQEINKITGAEILAVRFDTECSKPVPLSEYTKNKERLKRGGTDFKPIFAMADQLKIHLLIIFTDGDGEAPITANQKTLWVLTKNGGNPSSFGHSVYFEG